MDDDDAPSGPGGRPVLVSFFTSLLPTAAAFAGLTVADQRGVLDFLHADRRIDVEVPSIDGVSVEQARELLRAKDLLLALQAERADPAIPAGKVAGPGPPAGSRAPRGSAPPAVLSSGPRRIVLPPPVRGRAPAASQPPHPLERPP